jgi:glucose/arabinose dehydrogenase
MVKNSMGVVVQLPGKGLAIQGRRYINYLLMLCCVFFTFSGQTSSALKIFPAHQIDEVATGLDHPWSVAFLPTGGYLLTERVGNLLRFNESGQAEVIKGLPDDIYIKSQGGLLDVVLHPDYPQNGWIYLSYSSGSSSSNALKLIRAKLKGLQLTQLQSLFTVSPSKDTPVHFGGRITFLADNTLLLSTGDGFDYREDAQRLTSQLGKIIRLKDDGQIPTDNPFYGKGDNNAADAIYTLGHRNPQGLAYDPLRKLVFSSEHGPAGGDEVNIIVAGNNYGWPVITYGRDYSGASISPYKEYPGMQQPLIDWTPSIAPSGLAVYQGDMFPLLKGDLLAGALKFKELRWIQMQDDKVLAEVSLFKELKQRIRDVRVHPDGSIYLLTDSNEGKVLRVSAVK